MRGRGETLAPARDKPADAFLSQLLQVALLVEPRERTARSAPSAARRRDVSPSRRRRPQPRAHSCVELSRHPVGERLRDVLGQHGLRARERRDRLGHARDTGTAAPRERQPLDGAREQLVRRRRSTRAASRAALELAETRSATAAEGSAGGAASSCARGRGTVTTRSKRSSSARESLSRNAARRCVEQEHSTAGSPRPPHGQRFIVATSWNRAGKSAMPCARAMLTTPSSSGWRSASSAGRTNSGSSSSSRTPWCARLASPGRGPGPPPTTAATEAL